MQCTFLILAAMSLQMDVLFKKTHFSIITHAKIKGILEYQKSIINTKYVTYENLLPGFSFVLDLFIYTSLGKSQPWFLEKK